LDHPVGISKRRDDLANRRLTVRYERRADILTAFLHLAWA
jgi:hypothetical protein